MARVHLLVAVAHARQNGTDRFRGVLAHHVDLPWRGVRAQDHTVLIRVESVPHVTGGVIGRNVKQFEIIFVRLDLARAIDLETHLSEDFNDAAESLLQRMQPADKGFIARQRHVQLFLREVGSQLSCADGFLALIEGCFQSDLDLVGLLSHQGAGFFVQGAQLRENLHHTRAPTQVNGFPGCQLIWMVDLLQLC